MYVHALKTNCERKSKPVSRQKGSKEPCILSKEPYILQKEPCIPNDTYEGRVGFCSKRTCEFSGIQFTRHFIELVLMETKQFVSSISDVILTRHTCGQRSGRVAASKRRALACGFSVRKCYMFIIQKYRGEWDLSLCMTSGLAKRMLLCSADFLQILRPNTLKNRNSALRSGILFASPEVMRRLRSDSSLHFAFRYEEFIANLHGKMKY